MTPDPVLDHARAQHEATVDALDRILAERQGDRPADDRQTITPHSPRGTA